VQALDFRGGPGLSGAAQILVRTAVAAVLNASHPNINYPFSETAVISAVNDVLAIHNRTAMLLLTRILDTYDNLNCTVDAHGNVIP